MRGAVEEVGDFGCVSLAIEGADPTGVGAIADMAGVGHRSDIAFAQRLRAVGRVHRRRQRAGIAADAHEEEALRPGIRKLQCDTGGTIRRALALGHDSCLHAAEGGRGLGNGDTGNSQGVQGRWAALGAGKGWGAIRHAATAAKASFMARLLP